MQYPFEWNDGLRYFVTYYGVVYVGFAVSHPDIPNGLFIVPGTKGNEYKNLPAEKRTAEHYRTIGIEIADFNTIKNSYPAQNNDRLGGEGKFDSSNRTMDARYKRMFIFGAGASAFCTFGSEAAVLNNSPLKPPTGDRIFDEDFNDYCNAYPGVKLSLPGYEAAGRDIEAYLENEWQQIKKVRNPSLLRRHVNIQYYLQHLLSDVSQHVNHHFGRKNLYTLFANKLQQFQSLNPGEKSIVSTFNYDTILDNSLSEVFDLKFSSMTDYTDYSNPFLFFKFHGSVNWGWKFKSEEINKQKLDYLSRHLYNEGYDLADINFSLLGTYKENIVENSWGLEMSLNKNGIGRMTLNKDNIEIMNSIDRFYPALLLPYRDKDEFVMPYEHHNKLEFTLKEVEELYLIGWKGNEDTFNRLMEKVSPKLKKIIIVNPEEKNQGVTNNLIKYKCYQNVEIDVYSTFEEFVLKRMDMYMPIN